MHSLEWVIYDAEIGKIAPFENVLLHQRFPQYKKPSFLGWTRSLKTALNFDSVVLS